VWEALTLPVQVSVWDGAVPVDVPADYPRAGQHARWSSPLIGPLALGLHDHIRDVEAEVRLSSLIEIAFVRIEEEYRLTSVDGGTRLDTDNLVSSRLRLPGLDRLAYKLATRASKPAMQRLKDFVEGRT
jgi:hypothetical protein